MALNDVRGYEKYVILRWSFMKRCRQLNDTDKYETLKKALKLCNENESFYGFFLFFFSAYGILFAYYLITQIFLVHLEKN